MIYVESERERAHKHKNSWPDIVFTAHLLTIFHHSHESGMKVHKMGHHKKCILRTVIIQGTLPSTLGRKCAEHTFFVCESNGN